VLTRPGPVASAAVQQHDALAAWVVETGGATPPAKVACEERPGFGFCLIAKQPLKSGDPLLSIPQSLHLSVSSARRGPLGPAMDAVAAAVDEDESAALAVAILYERSLGERSSFAPYISILPPPESLDLPILWSAEQKQELLAGSHLSSMVESTLDTIRLQWARLSAQVFPAWPDLFPPKFFSEALLDDFVWTHALVLSRGLPFGDEMAMIPYLDYANHEAGSPNTCSISMSSPEGEEVAETVKAAVQSMSDLELLGGRSAAALTAGKDHAEGEQVFIDYGESGWRSSWEMLYTYGFVGGDTSPEWLSAGGAPLFFEGVRASDPLRQQKVAVLASLGAGEDAADGQWVDIKGTAESCLSMAPLLRLSHLSQESREAETLVADLAKWGADPQQTWAALQKPLGPKIEASVAQQVVAECEAALGQLPAAEQLAKDAADQGRSGEAGAAPPSDDSSHEVGRRRLAARVRLGERAALEACLQLWSRALQKGAAVK